MELRRDPITQAWVIQEDGIAPWPFNGECPLCPGREEAYCPQTLYEHPYAAGRWEVRVVPHPRPLYRIEGEAERRGEGIYDKMRNLGAHEILIEHRNHHAPLTEQTDDKVAQVLCAAASRIRDLKKDPRFRYISFFRNQGEAAGQDLEHPHAQITAMPFIPRSLVYELRSAERYFRLKERCLLCDIVAQEIRQQVRTVEWDEHFVAFCPFASRVPYEMWVLPLEHHCSFEEDLGSWERQYHFARFLKSLLRRVEGVAPAYHLVLHTSPNSNAKFEKPGHWQTLAQDWHWHFEILPVTQSRAKSYSIKEVSYNPLPPHTAAQELRRAETLTPAGR